MAVKETNVETQKYYLDFFLSSGELFTRAQNIFNPENFDRSLKGAATFIQEYTQKYSAIPSVEQVLVKTGTNLTLIDNIQESAENFLLDDFEQFTKKAELTRAIVKSVDLLDKDDFGSVEKLIKDAVQISLTRDLGINYFEDPKARLLKLKDSNGQVSTGWTEIDRFIFGGFNRGELEIFCGGPGCVTADTEIEVIELINLPNIVKIECMQLMTYSNVKDEIDYLTRFYTCSQIDYYAQGDDTKVRALYELAQPKKVTIGSLKNKVLNTQFLVSSPDGWVPVLDCIEKIKNILFRFTFKSGRKIVASHDHLYQTDREEWRYARECIVGDKFLSADGADEVLSIEPINKTTKVYDLSVNHDNHRYYTNGISSHNSGKSVVLQNLACNWISKGMNGIYITLELSQELVAMRIDSMITGISSKEIFRKLDDVELKVAIAGKKSGRLKIKFLPSGSTVNDIRAYVKELMIQENYKPDFICVDYLDLINPNSKIDLGDFFVKDKLVSEGLRNFGIELKAVIASASQLNRSSFDEIDFNLGNVAGGISKANSCDNMFGIYTSRIMKERGLIQLQMLKTRNSSGVGNKVDLDFNVDSLRITDATGGQPSESAMTGTNILAQIKNAPKSTPQVTSMGDKKDLLKTLMAQINKSNS